MFQWNFHLKFSRFLNISPQFVFFSTNGEEWTNEFVRIFEKYAKIMRFRKCLKKSFENFRKFWQNFSTMFFIQMREN